MKIHIGEITFCVLLCHRIVRMLEDGHVLLSGSFVAEK